MGERLAQQQKLQDPTRTSVLRATKRRPKAIESNYEPAKPRKLKEGISALVSQGYTGCDDDRFYDQGRSYVVHSPAERDWWVARATFYPYCQTSFLRLAAAPVANLRMQ
ncbi:hypothetical protein NMY22_g7439 [Coprinellus aureogranulatus]|nr:hypothetical protein NMY22_g7439 [Coprinellus aureogranulatus]